MFYNSVEEAKTTLCFIAYYSENQSSRYQFDYSGGEVYVGRVIDIFDSDNLYEVQLGEDEVCKEFLAISVQLEKEFVGKGRAYEEYLEVKSIDFPDRIIDIERGEVVYPREGWDEELKRLGIM